jgi:hypothetical protein
MIPKYEKADILFFSSYIWNFQINLEIARRIKAINPNVLTVFGGPQVPEAESEVETFLEQYKDVDIVCRGEGERPFTQLLENLSPSLWSQVPSISFKDPSTSRIVHNPPLLDFIDLDDIPSPYLTGIFDILMSLHPELEWSCLIETNRGCPYSCTFCYWGKRSKSKMRNFSLERVYQEIDWMSAHRIEFIFCCDSNFGLLKRDMDIAVKVANNKTQFGYPKAFSVQNTKNSTTKIFEVQKMLNDHGLQRGVNLALQSVNESTLENIHRTNISTQMYSELATLFVKNKIPSFSDIILALPGETYDSLTQGVAKLIEEGQHNKIQFINLCLLVNTVMDEEQYKKQFGLLVQKSCLISHHTDISPQDGIDEYQNLVIGTNTMCKDDWVRTRVFCWMLSLLYFDKLLQIVLLMINKQAHISYVEIIEAFMTKVTGTRSLLSIISRFVHRKAKDIQHGKPEYIASKEFLNIWWPINEYVFLKICSRGRLDQFYEEAESIIEDLLRSKDIKLPDHFLHQAILLNKSLIKLPELNDQIPLKLTYNIPEYYQSIIKGAPVDLSEGVYHYVINRTMDPTRSWEEWAQKVIWYGGKRGAYFYDIKGTGS